VEASKTDEDTIMAAAIEAGAEDVEAPEDENGAWTITTDPGEFLAVRDAIEKAGIEIAGAEITKIPSNTVALEGDDARKLLNLLDLIEEHDDVQKVYSNADLPDEVLAG
jgi:transcriptional/translational regulatory protein YebC/TACO1